MTAGSPDIAWPAVAAVVLVTAVASAMHWWLKHRGLLPAAVNPIKVVAMRSLGGKKSVAVVEVETQRFLLGLTDEAISFLSALPTESRPTALGTVTTLPTAVNG